jgi:tRNA(Glu) U13 pseudouridine synthase TruD
MRFRQSAQTFLVEEVPLFEPSGLGDHVCLWTRRSGLSTPFLLKQLQRALRVPSGSIDLRAEGQRVSLGFLLPPGSYASVLLAHMGVEVIPPDRHAAG